eukprot:CAMPEP_0178922280 /NCGR_PEP_ID=MMETSP0786-20121207/16063_1 /TAXON_ID=186022 /ORGANISM="Thalassionema frauenfeldii, Strain CCMP 1798" /LENGTH=462 /DNA_ID=CAMNT_0020596621 /DNA_START=139 /DNA_END=1527 /DNA_ORIENTATION=+
MISRGLGMASGSAPDEAFQRSLLEARLRYEGKLSVDDGDVDGAEAEFAAKLEEEKKSIEENMKTAAQLAAKLEAEKEAKAAEEERAAADLRAKQAAEAEKARKELAAKQEAEAEKARQELVAKQEAEKQAAEAQLVAKQEQEAAAEKARVELAAKQEAERKAAQEKKMAADRAAEEKRAATRRELDALVSRNEEIKARANTFWERIQRINWRRVLPTSEDLVGITSAIQEFKPKEAALSLKSRDESNTELVGIVAAGATNTVIDGLGTGVEIADAVRSDDELKSVVGDALDSTGDAFSALVSDVKDSDGVSAESLKRQAQLALCALDSLGSAAFASLCAVVGYTQEGTPVAESASRATKGLFSASSAAVALGIRGFDVVVKQSGNVAKEAKEAVRMAQELDVEANQMAPELDVADSTSSASSAIEDEKEEDAEASDQSKDEIPEVTTKDSLEELSKEGVEQS